jgi:hypothetical protein
MTAKEKASGLILRFEMHANPYELKYAGVGNIHTNYDKNTLKIRSKLCAKILVDEIIRNLSDTIPFFASNNELLGSESYWKEVKQEIEKL